MYGIKRESGEVLCHGCLSADRKLSPLTDYELFFTMLGNKQSVEEYKYLNIPLCWECHALLRRMLVFRHRLQRAQYVLSLADTQQISTDSLSTLEYNYKEDIDCFVEECFESEPDTEIVKDNDVGKELKMEFEENSYEIDNIETNYSDTCQTEKEIEPPPKKKMKYKKAREKAKMQKNDSCLDLSNLDNYFSKVFLCEKEVDNILAKEREQDVSRPYKCNYCGFHFGTKTELNTHRKNMHRQCPSVGKCPHCPFSYKTPWDLELHCWRKHEASRCALCGALVARANCLRRHLRLHSRRYWCRECDVEFDNKQSFTYHDKQLHSKYLCDNCDQVFVTKKTLEKHITRHHLPNKCPDCGVVCPTWASLRRHHTNYHVRSGAPEAYCVECDTKFATPAKYKRHLSQSARHRPKKKIRVPCPECGKLFSRTHHKNNHMKLVHFKQSRYHCQLCDKYYVNGSALSTHLKFVHEKMSLPKTKICSVCGRGFGEPLTQISKSSPKDSNRFRAGKLSCGFDFEEQSSQHKQEGYRIHFTEVPIPLPRKYVCETNRILTHHMRTHTGERPFACTHCSAAFAQRYALKSHLASIHKEK